MNIFKENPKSNSKKQNDGNRESKKKLKETMLNPINREEFRRKQVVSDEMISRFWQKRRKTKIKVELMLSTNIQREGSTLRNSQMAGER